MRCVTLSGVSGSVTWFYSQVPHGASGRAQALLILHSGLPIPEGRHPLEQYLGLDCSCSHVVPRVDPRVHLVPKPDFVLHVAALETPFQEGELSKRSLSANLIVQWPCVTAGPLAPGRRELGDASAFTQGPRHSFLRVMLRGF